MCRTDNIQNTCCFLGHREICETEELRMQLYRFIEKLITQEQIDTFLFGSKSRFGCLCYDIVTDMKARYKSIRRIYVRAEFPEIGKDYREYLLASYEDTYYPDCARKAGKAVYIKRNYEMIDKSRICIFYYRPTDFLKDRNSGTKIAWDYAHKCQKMVFLFPGETYR